ncbi:hypothetical protein HYT02_01305 [Candidatus Gottesmanbacteria bacterium]|nr:hypothetical protein [Candidatus Gottesmanbacteria bacterium]
MLKRLIITVLIWKLLLIYIVLTAVYFLPFNTTFTPFKNIDIMEKDLIYSVAVFANFDGIHYLDIARRGYFKLEQPFFPFYPILVRSFVAVSGSSYIIASQLISITCLILALYYIYKLLLIDKKQNLFTLILLVILTFPTSYSYSASYNDSLFLLLATFTLYLGRVGRWRSASLVSGLAVLTRLNGLALPFFLVTEYMEHKNPKKLVNISLFILIPALAFLLYLIYVQMAFGDWNLIFTTMKIWGQDKVILPMQTFWRYFKIVFVHPNIQITYFVALFEVISVLAYIMLALYTFRKIRLSYWLFMCVSFLIPAFTGTFQGMPRYALHLYPLFLGIALFLSKSSKFVRIFYFVISILLLIISLSLFSRGYFVA